MSVPLETVAPLLKVFAAVTISAPLPLPLLSIVVKLPSPVICPSSSRLAPLVSIVPPISFRTTGASRSRVLVAWSVPPSSVIGALLLPRQEVSPICNVAPMIIVPPE